MTPTKIPVVKFPAKGIKLTPSEKKVVQKLIQAAQSIVPIYLKEENNRNNGANFYPRDATRVQILEAAKKNPEILSPFTIVERDKKGKLPLNLRFETRGFHRLSEQPPLNLLQLYLHLVPVGLAVPLVALLQSGQFWLLLVTALPLQHRIPYFRQGRRIHVRFGSFVQFAA